MKTVILCILDGFGIAEDKENAIAKANTPCLNYLFANYPNTTINASENYVGLPKGQMGNSEVGHMTIGSGRVIYQDLVRINQAIESDSLKDNPDLLRIIEHHQKSKTAVHLMGLCSDGGVHSHINHMIYLAKLIEQNNIEVKLHLFLDGRDVAPKSATQFLEQIDQLLKRHSQIKIASIAGRFYAMDRDNRLERTKLSVKTIAEGIPKITSWQDYLSKQYEQNITDEFIVPAAFNDYDGIKKGDSIIFTNFRSDRIRQLAHKILELDFAYKIGMTHYSKELSLTSLFKEQLVKEGLGEILSSNNKKQLHIAETEKYAHVTFFFNGGREEPYVGEDRILIASPKVKTYDLQPEMSAFKVTEELVNAIGKYDFIVVNYANADMVGHCGKMAASIEAVEVLDKVLQEIYKAIKQNEGVLLITSDHGNIESMGDEHNPHTAHTLNPVPLIMVGMSNLKLKQGGSLSDIAPTILEIINIKQPDAMTGKSLIGS